MTSAPAVFFFEGHTRLQLGFPTPNYLGAFVAAMLPLQWAASSFSPIPSKWMQWISRIVEGGGLLLIAATYSRGATLAYLVAAAIFSVVQTQQTKRRIQFIAPRLAVLVICALSLGFWKRATPSYVAADASAMNRLPVWEGAAVLFSVRPLSGWGWGSSGQSYVNWVQEQGPDNYVGVLNSFLQINAELGGIVGAAFIACVFTPLVGAWRARTIKPDAITPLAAVAASICAWTVTNSFSTLGESQILNGIAVAIFLTAIGLLVFHCSTIETFRSAGIAMAIALTINCAIYCWGRFANSRAPVPLDSAPGGVITLGDRSAPLRVDVRIDPSVLGPHSGKQLRRMLVAQRTACLFNVLPTTAASHAEANAAVYFGDTWALTAIDSVPNRRIFFYPRVLTVSTDLPKSAEVWLPSKISNPEDDAWQDYCRRRQLTIRYSSSSTHRYADLPWPRFF